MTPEKINEVLDMYEMRLADYSSSWSNHVVGMIPKVRTFVQEGRMEKAFRWLGFIQGAFWLTGVYTIDEMRKHNMPTDGDASQ